MVDDTDEPTLSFDFAAGATDRRILPPGTRIGRYRIDALVGIGGMGEVYRAEQLEPVRRVVAIKRLRGHQLDPQARVLFDLERQVLARMQHPAIATIFDAGTSDAGEPWFAMEFVEGETVTEWCDRRQLPLEERLALFIRVGEGVQHAHQKGVIHRDLKPSNLLVADVDGLPHPKIIDFGIATGARGDGMEGEPVSGAGTPAYMSPEQAAGRTLDTRSDIYALGLVLHELLSGQRRAHTDTAERTPTRPSLAVAAWPPDRLQEGARRRGLPPSRWARALRRELDWIVAKAVAPDRNDRYSSMGALLDDLRRYQEGRVVEAVPPSTAYRLGVWARRRRWAIAAGMALTASVAGGFAGTLAQLREAERQRALAERRSADVEAIAAFQQRMFERIDMAAMGAGLQAQLGEAAMARIAREPEAGRAALQQTFDALRQSWDPIDVSRRQLQQEVLDKAVAALDAEFGDRPDLDARLRQSIADAAMAIGAYPTAIDTLEPAVRLLEPIDARRAAVAMGTQAQALAQMARFEAAVAQFDAALQRLPEGAETRHQRLEFQVNRAAAVAALGRHAEAESALAGIVAEVKADPSAPPTLMERALANHGRTLLRLGRRDEALATSLDVLQRMESRLGAQDLAVADARVDLGIVEAIRGHPERGLHHLRDAVAAYTKTKGATHPVTLRLRATLGAMQSDAGDFPASDATLKAALRDATSLLGEEGPQVLRLRSNLATLYARSGDNARGLEQVDAVLAARRRLLGDRHPDTLWALGNRAGMLRDLQQPHAALAAAIELQAGREALQGASHPDTLSATLLVADLHRRTGRPAEALRQAEAALALAVAAYGANDARRLSAAVQAHEVLSAIDGARAAELRRTILAPLLGAPPEALPDALQPLRRSLDRQSTSASGSRD